MQGSNKLKKFNLFILVLIFVNCIYLISSEEIKVFILVEDESSLQKVEEIIEEEKIITKFEDRIVIKVDEKEIDELSKNKEIRGIEEVGKRNLFLEDTIFQINASETHAIQSKGLNLTGSGQSICLIDSGVNYFHSFFNSCYGDNGHDNSCKILGGFDFVNNDANPMDDNGHGTNLAGIILTISPDSKILSLKACDNSGVCEDDRIMSSIDWCISNKDLFNISVISMSLGSGLYADYCNDDPLAGHINKAVNNEISVVVASGNSGSKTEISSPACVEKAIPVSGIKKDDSTIIYDRSFLVKLLAPALLIKTTSIKGGYNSASGTSMAAPHVSGAIAIINQFLDLSENTKTPSEIEDLLYENGKKLEEDTTIFSRIDILSSIIKLDISPPEINLVFPENNSLISPNQIFECNISDNLILKNITLRLWNSSSTIEKTYENTSQGVYRFGLDNLSGEYLWKCYGRDINNNLGYSEDRSVSVKLINLEALPLNNIHTNKTGVFNCTAEVSSSIELKEIRFQLFNSSNQIYKESKNLSGRENNTLFNYSFISEGEYSWNCAVYSNNSDSLSLENRTLFYDITSPVIALISPDNSTSSTTNSYNFTFNSSDNFEIENCNLIFDDLIINSITNANNTAGTNSMYNSSLISGEHKWRIECLDKAENKAVSEQRILTINENSGVITGGVSEGGGGGGGGSSTGAGGGGGGIIGKVIVNNSSNKTLSSGVNKGIEENEKESEIKEEEEDKEYFGSKILGATISLIGDISTESALLFCFALIIFSSSLLIYIKKRIKTRKKQEKSKKKTKADKKDKVKNIDDFNKNNTNESIKTKS